MRTTKAFHGINIQFPISQLILSGQKTIETRLYPLPKTFVNIPLAIIETPGKTGKFKARISGLIIFSRSFKYTSELTFYRDFDKHCVQKGSPWAWVKTKSKWGWEISRVVVFDSPKKLTKRHGIRYTNNLELALDSEVLRLL